MCLFAPRDNPVNINRDVIFSVWIIQTKTHSFLFVRLTIQNKNLKPIKAVNVKFVSYKSLLSLRTRHIIQTGGGVGVVFIRCLSWNKRINRVRFHILQLCLSFSDTILLYYPLYINKYWINKQIQIHISVCNYDLRIAELSFADMPAWVRSRSI